MPNKTLEKWEEKTLGNICDLQNGFAFSSKDYIEYSNTLNIRMSNIRPNGIFDETHNIKYLPDNYAELYKDYILNDGDLIIAMTDMAGDPKILGVPTVIKHKNKNQIFLMNQRVGRLLNFSEDISIAFLKYLLISPSIQKVYKSKGKGGVQLNISKNDILSIKILIPNKIEQQRIVGILDEAFENIEKAKQNALQNLNNAKELFESYLDKAFTENTDNWNKYKVKDVCKYAKEQGHYNLPYVGMEHIKGSTAEFIGSLDNTEVKSTTFHFDKGIILYGRLRPYLRKVILTTFEGHCSTELFPIKVNDKVNNKFLMYWLLSQRITDKINATWTGARMPRANMNKVLEFDISIPSIMEQQKIVVQLDELQEQTKKLEQIYEQKIKDLDELKQSILQKAFNGEL